MDYQTIIDTANAIKENIGDFSPKVAIVLGSGFGEVIDSIENKVEIPYKDVPNMPVSTVAGHKGSFIFGNIESTKVAVMNGRVHLYEGYSVEQVVLPIRVLRLLGCETIILTNAAGGISYNLKAGDLMALNDHISIFAPNPLIGKNIDQLGTRFPDMSCAYDRELTKLLSNTAIKCGIPLKEGVYAQLTGPSYETPAEIRMLRSLGADAVGMSTVCEVIAARHCGLKVVAMSLITNLACGMENKELNHKEVQEMGANITPKISKLIKSFVPLLKG